MFTFVQGKFIDHKFTFFFYRDKFIYKRYAKYSLVALSPLKSFLLEFYVFSRSIFIMKNLHGFFSDEKLALICGKIRKWDLCRIAINNQIF